MHMIFSMAKTTFKLLLRNKAFLFFAVLLPVMATLILNINIGTENVESGLIIHIPDHGSHISGKVSKELFAVKVYLVKESDLTNDLFEGITDAGLFQLFLVDSSELSEEEILTSAKDVALHDCVDSILVIRNSYEDQLKSGSVTDSVTLYKIGDDDRYDLFEATLTDGIKKQIDSVKLGDIKLPVSVKKNVEIEAAKEASQSITKLAVDGSRLTLFSNTMALYTVSFLLAGVIILGTILTERDNLVYTRILLTKTDATGYILSKLLVVFAVSVVQTIIVVLSFALLVRRDIGLTIPEFAFVIFMMALIFNFLSIGFGVWCKNVMSACLVGFCLWMFSAVLAGLYFDISHATESFQRIALLMPERWAMQASSMFMAGDSTAYPMLFTVSMMYLVVILLVGRIGLAFSKKE